MDTIILQSDKEIVDMFFKRDERAIYQAQKRYSSYLTKTAMNILNSVEDSLECVNDTYLRAWNSIPPNRPQKLSLYLAKITRGLAIDRLRRITAKKHGGSLYDLSVEELEGVFYSSDSPEADIDASLLSEAVSTFLRNRKNEERNAFVRRYYFCDSIKDIASTYNYSESKVKSMLFRIRSDLYGYLKEGGYIV